ncbi:hypothetical protein CSC17_1187 [Klebsiella oxytoca]|nr:hypothetical protein CSC17_1187 [Klebsiella oxytoca]
MAFAVTNEYQLSYSHTLTPQYTSSFAPPRRWLLSLTLVT